MIRRPNLPQRTGINVPLLPCVRYHRHRLLVVSGQYSQEHGTPRRLKADSLADSELQHLGVGAALLKESKTSNDPVVQIDEFLFAEVLNINVHGATLSLRFHATAVGRTDFTQRTLGHFFVVGHGKVPVRRRRLSENEWLPRCRSLSYPIFLAGLLLPRARRHEAGCSHANLYQLHNLHRRAGDAQNTVIVQLDMFVACLHLPQLTPRLES